uniref:Peptidase C1A papain C-terminal domain-containing protein n=1 Tax=Oryza meridionalis TaxID=40149 RepID=A0A0E0F0S1_9ORYZ
MAARRGGRRRRRVEAGQIGVHIGAGAEAGRRLASCRHGETCQSELLAKDLGDRLLTFDNIQELSLQVHSVKKLLDGAMDEICTDPLIGGLVKISKNNDITLKCLKSWLKTPFPPDVTDSIKSLHDRNRNTSKTLSGLEFWFHIYRTRFHEEASWMSNFPLTLEVLLRKFSSLDAGIMYLQDQGYEMLRFTEVLSSGLMCDKSSESYCWDICSVFNLSLRIHWWTQICMVLVERISTLLCEVKEHESILDEKLALSHQLFRTEGDLEDKYAKLEEQFSKLERDVEAICRVFDPAVTSKNREEALAAFEKAMHGKEFCWRGQMFHGVNILLAVKIQGKNQCAFVASVSAVESLYKKDFVSLNALGGCSSNRQTEFLVQLSEDHLQDMVVEYLASNKGNRGIASQENYKSPLSQDSRRYHIRDFEQVIPTKFEEATDILKKGNVFVAHFPIMRDYFRLEKDRDHIYHVPDDAVFETTPAGKEISHAVMIVGFGRSADGMPYYIFQNSYGPGWCDGGFGRISAASIRGMYAANIWVVNDVKKE